MTQLLEELKKRQGTKPNKDFARELNISRQLWSHIRHNRRQLSSYVLTKIAQAYPDLQEQALSLMGFKNDA